MTVVTLAIDRRDDPQNYDLKQLGEDLPLEGWAFSSYENSLMFQRGTVALRPGDSITDQKGGLPIIGEVRGIIAEKSFSLVKDHDYRDVATRKYSGTGEH